jgi:hypothetical protein
MSVDQIKKFLEDAQGYPDTTMVRIGDTEVPLGSLRSLNKGEREQLATAIKTNDDKARELDERQKKVIELAGKAQAAYDAAQAAAAKANATPPNPSNDPFSDPWLAPVKKELDGRDKTINELQNTVKQLSTVIQNAATIWSEDRWDREFTNLDFGKREKKPSREELIKFATENKLFDRHGIPSVRAAWDKMSETDRLEELRKSEFEKGREAGRMEQMASRIPPPGVAGPGMPVNPPKAAPGELGDLYGEAIKDPELRALIEQLPAGMA